MKTTKNLSELTKNILQSTLTHKAKAEALVKIGVTPYEAMVLAKASMPKRGAKFSYTFGVEIECVNCPQDIFLLKARENALQVEERMYYNHNDIPRYKLVPDSSLRGNNPAECVTPALKGKRVGFKSLKDCCKTLSDVGATVNRTCGLHVHIGAANLTDSEYCNVFVNYMRLETAIGSFLAPSRRGANANWCASLRNHETDVLRATTRRDMFYAPRHNRYHRVNPCSYNVHKTIEFRQHQGTTQYKKISAWVKFLGKLVEWSRTNRLDTNIDRIEDIPFLTASEKRYFMNRREAFTN